MKLNLKTTRAQETILAFMGAILAGDEAAVHVYADWLTENGHPEKARRVLAQHAIVLAMPTNGRKTDLQENVHTQLVWRAHKLTAKYTAFRGYHGMDGIFMAMHRGYVPTLNVNKPGYRTLALVLRALGHKVFALGTWNGDW